MCVCLWVSAQVCPSTHAEVRGQCWGVGSLLPHCVLRTELRSSGLCPRQPLSPTEPSPWPIYFSLIFVPAQIGGASEKSLKNIEAFHTQTLFLSLHEIVTDLLRYMGYISLLFPVFPFHHVSWEHMIYKAACVQIPETRAVSRCHSCLLEVVSLNCLMCKSPR